MTKIYCDIADINLIKKFNKKIVKGFTTNPSLMRKAGAKDYQKYSKNILKITKKPVSCEVFADDEKNMIIQGNRINKWGKNVFVKVPITNSKGKLMSKVIKTLSRNKIKLNITAVYTANQTKQILKNIDKKTKVIISIFAGRIVMLVKIQFQNLKKVLKFQKVLKMCKFFGRVQENHTITFKQKN